MVIPPETKLFLSEKQPSCHILLNHKNHLKNNELFQHDEQSAPGSADSGAKIARFDAIIALLISETHLRRSAQGGFCVRI